MFIFKKNHPKSQGLGLGEELLDIIPKAHPIIIIIIIKSMNCTSKSNRVFLQKIWNAVMVIQIYTHNKLQRTIHIHCTNANFLVLMLGNSYVR